MVPSGPLLKTEKDKNNNKKLEPKYRCSPSLVYFFISAVVKLKKKKKSSGSSTLSHCQSGPAFERLVIPASQGKAKGRPVSLISEKGAGDAKDRCIRKF